MPAPFVDISSGDIRRFARKIGQNHAVLKNKITKILLSEAKITKVRLENWATGKYSKKPQRITGALRRASGFTWSDTPYSVTVRFGYLFPEDDDTRSAARVLTGRVPMPIVPVHAKKLAWAVRGKSPTDIISAGGKVRKMVREISHLYYLRYYDNAIYGRKLSDRTSKKLVFLFRRAASVVVPDYIEMNSEIFLFQSRVMDRLSREVGIDLDQPLKAVIDRPYVPKTG